MYSPGSGQKSSRCSSRCSISGLYLAYWLSERFDAQAPTGPLIILLAVQSQFKSFMRCTIMYWLIGPILKNVSMSELAAAIHKAHAGRSTIAPEAAHVFDAGTGRRLS